MRTLGSFRRSATAPVEMKSSGRASGLTGPDSSRDREARVRGNLRRGLALVRRRTPRGRPLHVRLYEKADCGLCAETYRALTRVRMDVALEIERVDILIDPVLFESYALRIPVLAVGDRELDAAGLEDAALRRWVATVT